MAVLSHKQINEILLETNVDDQILNAKYKCALCGTEIEINDHYFATAVVNKCKLPECPVCGEEAHCVGYEVKNE